MLVRTEDIQCNTYLLNGFIYIFEYVSDVCQWALHSWKSLRLAILQSIIGLTFTDFNNILDIIMVITND